MWEGESIISAGIKITSNGHAGWPITVSTGWLLCVFVCEHMCVCVSLIFGCPCYVPHVSDVNIHTYANTPHTVKPVSAVGSDVRTHSHTHAHAHTQTYVHTCSKSLQLFSVSLLSNWQTLSRPISSIQAFGLSSFLPSDGLLSFNFTSFSILLSVCLFFLLPLS